MVRHWQEIKELVLGIVVTTACTSDLFPEKKMQLKGLGEVTPSMRTKQD
jgi:hypothetical protein